MCTGKISTDIFRRTDKGQNPLGVHRGARFLLQFSPWLAGAKWGLPWVLVILG